jgi:hypothetical protein
VLHKAVKALTSIVSSCLSVMLSGSSASLAFSCADTISTSVDSLAVCKIVLCKGFAKLLTDGVRCAVISLLMPSFWVDGLV